jgi:hypothetical protein
MFPNMENLPFTLVIRGRHWYFRTKATGRIALPNVPGTPEFHRKYGECLQLRERLLAGLDEGDTGSFAWLIGQYQRSAEFAALAEQTQTSYARTLKLLEAELGTQPFKLTTRAMLKAVRDDYAATPRKAHKIKLMISRL